MTAFLLIFLSVYTCMHAVFFLRVRNVLCAGTFGQVLLSAFLLLMIVAPIFRKTSGTRRS